MTASTFPPFVAVIRSFAQFAHRCLFLFLLVAVAHAAPVQETPVEIIGSQFGIFDASTPDELSFEPTTLIPRVVGQRYGWIIELKTSKRNVSVREEYLIALPAKGAAAGSSGTEAEKDEFLDGFRQAPQRRNQVSQRQLAPVDGQIYGEWSVGKNEPAGHRRLQVFIEGKLAATFEYDMK